MKARFY